MFQLVHFLELFIPSCSVVLPLRTISFNVNNFFSNFPLAGLSLCNYSSIVIFSPPPPVYFSGRQRLISAVAQNASKEKSS